MARAAARSNDNGRSTVRSGLVRMDDRQRHRRSLPEQVATYVRELIVSGQVRPGQYLRMDAIAKAVGVSNTPVREAMLALRTQGFLRLEPRRGFVVAPFTKQDVRDLFWAQARLAGELAARAAGLVTSEQIARLEANLDEYERASEAGDRPLLAKLGHDFHREVNVAAGSHGLALLLGSVVSQLPNSFYAAIEGQVDASRSQHPLIMEALRRRQPRKARKIMEDHIRERADNLNRFLEERGQWMGWGAERSDG